MSENTSNAFIAVEPPKNNEYNEPRKSGRSLRRNGVNYYISIKRPNARNRHTIRNSLFSRNPIYRDAEFRSAPDGIYTWIFSDKGFAAIQVKNTIEFGTLHANLAERVGAIGVYVAGECRKFGNSIEFNTFSGTYSLELISMNTNGNTRSKKLWTLAKRIFDNMGFETKDTQNMIKTYITNEYVPVQLRNLKNYKNIGYNVKLFTRKTNVNALHKARLTSRKRVVQGEINAAKARGSEPRANLVEELRNINTKLANIGTSEVNYSSWEN